MKSLSWIEVCKLAVKHVGKPAVYVSNGLKYDNSPEENQIWEFVREEMKSIYGVGTDEFRAVLSGLIYSGLFFFDSKEEQDRFYKIFEQPLTDSSSIYACTYNSDGELITENT